MYIVFHSRNEYLFFGNCTILVFLLHLKWATLNEAATGVSLGGGPASPAPTVATLQAAEPVLITPHQAAGGGADPQTSMAAAAAAVAAAVVAAPTLRQNSADLMLSSASASVMHQPKQIRPAVSNYAGQNFKTE